MKILFLATLIAGLIGCFSLNGANCHGEVIEQMKSCRLEGGSGGCHRDGS